MAALVAAIVRPYRPQPVKRVEIAENDVGSLGDTSTLADPAVVSDLIEHRPQA